MKYTKFMFIIMIISLMICSCDENKKTEQKNKDKIVENNNLDTITPIKYKDERLSKDTIEENKNFDTIVPTKYKDGRLSEVRMFNYYYASKDTAIEKKRRQD